ncbi:MAG: ATP-binding protein [Bdellovibrionota bacterium]
MENPALPLPPINILLVDDRPENIQALMAILGGHSYNLLTASSGPEALSVVLKHDLALILLDIFMGGMDGYEVATLIKGSKKSRQIPIIFLTAMAKDIENIFKAYSIGAVDYIQKPLEPNIVQAKVAVFAELYRNKLQIQQQAEVIRQKELKEKEYELLEVKRAGEKRLQDLVEGIDHGFVWSADPESLSFTFVSPRAEVILGYPLERWRSEPGFWANHLHPEDREAVLGAFKKAQMGRDLGFDHRFLTVEGGEAWLHTGVRLARRGEGVGNELRGLSVDITYLKRVEAALRESVHVRDEFLSIASHELKTPITPLKLQVQQMERSIELGRSLSPEQIKKFTQVWNRQLDRLAHLIDDLLDVSRISAGRLMIHREEVDLVPLIHEVTERYRSEATRTDTELQLSLPPELFGQWDRLRVEQVYTNLLTNSLKYAPGKPIRVTLSSRDENAFLTIQDSGMGIPLEKQGKIFDRFERAVDSAKFGGLGLGLYITRQIVQAHLGSIRVESEPGQGATFIVELPLRATDQNSTREVAA